MKSTKSFTGKDTQNGSTNQQYWDMQPLHHALTAPISIKHAVSPPPPPNSFSSKSFNQNQPSSLHFAAPVLEPRKRHSSEDNSDYSEESDDDADMMIFENDFDGDIVPDGEEYKRDPDQERKHDTRNQKGDWAKPFKPL